MTSKVEIANGALQRLGEKRIESLTQNHPNARSMNAVFTRSLKAEMRRYDWGFAIKRDSIARDGTDAAWGDWFRYSLPNDYIRLVFDDETGQSVDWKIEGRYILSRDSAPLLVRYIAFIEDPNLYDALFVDALECRLAAVTCKEITGSDNYKQSILEDYKTAIAEARRCQAIEKGSQEFPEDSWINARR